MNECEKDEEINVNKPSIKNLKNSERVAALFTDYFYKCFFAKDVKVNPFDTLVLKAHYNFTSHLLFMVFALVSSHWLVEEPIVCIDRSDRSRPPEELLDICLSYSYVEYPLNNDRNRMVRRYVLFYKWVHISGLILSFLCKGVVLMQRILSFKKLNKMLEDITNANLQDKYWIAKRYYIKNVGCHNNLYLKFLFIHVMALVINVVCFTGLNITFQNEYWDLPKNLMVRRDPSTFHDPFSLVFPPFTKCEITDVHHILIRRTKWFGCHLPLMEIYEKVFMILWFWQVFLGIWTLIYIIINIPFPMCKSWKLNLLCDSSFNKFEPFKFCAKKFSTDDLMALGIVKCVLLGNHYVKLVWGVSGHSQESEDSLDPNETVYFDNEVSSKENVSNEIHGNFSSFQSCSEEHKKNEIPLGFVTPPKTSKYFNPTSSSTLLHQRIKETYFTSTRCRSVEFEGNAVKTDVGFNLKISPFNLQCDASKTAGGEISVNNSTFPKRMENCENVAEFESNNNNDWNDKEDIGWRNGEEEGWGKS